MIFFFVQRLIHLFATEQYIKSVKDVGALVSE